MIFHMTFRYFCCVPQLFCFFLFFFYDFFRQFFHAVKYHFQIRFLYIDSKCSAKYYFIKCTVIKCSWTITK